MSTKTTFKRVSLVVASALAMGVISIANANAAIVGTPTVTTTNGTATIAKSDSTGAATVAVRFYTSATNSGDTAVVSATAGTKPTSATFATSGIMVTALDTSSASGAASVLAGVGTSSALNQTAWATTGGLGKDSNTATYARGMISPGASAGYGYGKFGFFLDSNSANVRYAGTYTVDYLVQFYETGVVKTTAAVAGTINIVVTDSTAAAAGSVAASATSTAIMNQGAGFFPGSTVDSTVAVVNTPSSTTPSAVIQITQKQADGTPAQESITVTINVGNVGTATSATGKNVTFAASASGIDTIGVFADGTGGVATITIKTTSVTFANKQVTFYGGTVASITATLLQKTLGGTAANVILAKAYDAGNNQVLGDTAVYAYSSNTDVIATTGSTTTPGVACTYSATYGGQLCNLSGSTNGTATITLRDASTAALSKVTAVTAGTITVNTLAPAAIKMALNKTSYAPGEVAYLSVWAVDAAGKIVGNNTFTNLLATGGITSTVAVGNGSDTTTATGFTTAARVKAIDGIDSQDPVKVYKVYMPYTGGDISFSATGGTTLPASGQVAVSVTANVTDNGASALASVTALASQVSAFITKINAQITTLTDLVMKIQKKVKA